MGNRRKNAPLSHFCIGCIHLQSMVKTEIIHTSSYLLPGSQAHLWGPDSRFSPGIVPLPCPARGLRLQGTRQPGSELLWRSSLLYRLVKDTSSPEGSLLLTSTSHCHGNWFPLYERRRRSLALKHRLVQEEGGRVLTSLKWKKYQSLSANENSLKMPSGNITMDLTACKSIQCFMRYFWTKLADSAK